MAWLVNNLGSVVTMIVVVLGVVATWVMYGADIKQLKKDLRELKEQREKDHQELKEKLDNIEKTIHAHESDTTLHIDPRRDEKRWDDFKDEIFRRFDGLDTNVAKLMIIHRPTAGSL